jgi:gas vesicle protein
MTKVESKTSTGKGILYLIFGGGIGAILALLFAPKTGKELRGDIGDAANKGLNKAEAFAGKVGEKTGGIYRETKTKAGEVYEAAKQKLDSANASLTKIAGEIETAAENEIFRRIPLRSSKNEGSKA